MSNLVSADPLFIGLTRKPLLFGVSYTFAVMNAAICMLLYIVLNQFYYLFAILPIHIIGLVLCSYEPLFLELFQVKISKCPNCPNKIYHGANSYDQF